jgi:hypothetical protein
MSLKFNLVYAHGCTTTTTGVRTGKKMYIKWSLQKIQNSMGQAIWYTISTNILYTCNDTQITTVTNNCQKTLQNHLSAYGTYVLHRETMTCGYVNAIWSV